MPYHLLATGYLLLLTSALSAQINVDSLLKTLPTAETPAEGLQQLDEWVIGRRFSEIDDPVTLHVHRWELAKAGTNRDTEVRAALDLIQAGNYSGAYALADSLSFTYGEDLTGVTEPMTRAAVYHEAAKAAFFGQAYEEAVDYDSLALGELDPLSPERAADSLANHVRSYLGKSLNAGGRFVAAATILSDAIERSRLAGPDTLIMIELYTELGIVYSQIGLYDRAVEYLDRSAAFGDALPPVSYVNYLINTGRNLLLTGDYPAARNRYARAYAYPLREALQVVTQSYSLNGLIEAHYRMDDRDSVNFYHKLYANFLRDHPDQAEVNGFLFQQSDWIHALMNGQLDEALRVGTELLDGARESNDAADLLYYTELLADTYRQRGEFRQADILSRELLARKDSLQSANRNDALLLYYNQFETQEKENEILRLDAERARISASRTLFGTAAALLALLLLTGGYFFLQLRAARRKLSLQNERLEDLNATKDRFFGIIAHDLRNPIAALRTADWQVDRLLDRGQTERVRGVVSAVSETATQLSSLLDNLLSWALSQSRAIELQPEPLPLAEEVASIRDLYQSAAENKDLSIALDIADNPTVYADRNALQTILRNLVGNAVKFSPAGTITLGHRREGNYDVLTVQDEGPGLDSALLNEAFELQGKRRKRSGTGLGLVLCRELTELHGGRIKVSSSPGDGALFEVFLPVVG